MKKDAKIGILVYGGIVSIIVGTIVMAPAFIFGNTEIGVLNPLWYQSPYAWMGIPILILGFSSTSLGFMLYDMENTTK